MVPTGHRINGWVVTRTGRIDGKAGTARQKFLGTDQWVFFARHEQCVVDGDWQHIGRNGIDTHSGDVRSSLEDLEIGAFRLPQLTFQVDALFDRDLKARFRLQDVYFDPGPPFDTGRLQIQLLSNRPLSGSRHADKLVQAQNIEVRRDALQHYVLYFTIQCKSGAVPRHNRCVDCIIRGKSIEKGLAYFNPKCIEQQRIIVVVGQACRRVRCDFVPVTARCRDVRVISTPGRRHRILCSSENCALHFDLWMNLYEASQFFIQRLRISTCNH